MIKLTLPKRRGHARVKPRIRFDTSFREFPYHPLDSPENLDSSYHLLSREQDSGLQNSPFINNPALSSPTNSRVTSSLISPKTRSPSQSQAGVSKNTKQPLTTTIVNKIVQKDQQLQGEPVTPDPTNSPKPVRKFQIRRAAAVIKREAGLILKNISKQLRGQPADPQHPEQTLPKPDNVGWGASILKQLGAGNQAKKPTQRSQLTGWSASFDKQFVG